MWLSQAAYQPEDFEAFAAGGAFAAWGLEQPQAFSASKLGVYSTGFHAFRGEAAFLVFAGTDPAYWQTIATDVLAIQARGRDLHLGFWRAFRAVEPQVRAFLDRVEARKLFVCGHSLGGALALHAAGFALDYGVRPTGIYAYGVPRVGGKAFAARYAETLGDVTYRLVHGEDLAARIPSSRITLPGGRTIFYRHVGRLLRCPPGGRFDAAELSPDPLSDEPPAPSSREWLTGRFLRLDRWRSTPNPKFYTGAKAALVGLRPPALRHHMQDQYLHALRPADQS